MFAFQRKMQEEHTSLFHEFTAFKAQQKQQQEQKGSQQGSVAGQGLIPQRIVPQHGFHNKVAASMQSPFMEHTQRAERGMVSIHPPIPMPPISAHTMVPMNQYPADMNVYIPPGTFMRQLRHTQDPRPFDPRDQAVRIRPGVGTTQNNISDLSKGILSQQAQLLPESLVNSKQIAHPLNRFFTQIDDPYNQGGKEFVEKMSSQTRANSRKPSRLTSSHISGQRNRLDPEQEEARGLTRGDGVPLLMPAENNASDITYSNLHIK